MTKKKQIELIDLDLDESKFAHNMILTRFFATISIGVLLIVTIYSIEFKHWIWEFSVNFLLLCCLLVSLDALIKSLKLREKIKSLYSDKRKLLKK